MKRKETVREGRNVAMIGVLADEVMGCKSKSTSYVFLTFFIPWVGSMV
jgi:hypothetical protein